MNALLRALKASTTAPVTATVGRKSHVNMGRGVFSMTRGAAALAHDPGNAAVRHPPIPSFWSHYYDHKYSASNTRALGPLSRLSLASSTPPRSCLVAIPGQRTFSTSTVTSNLAYIASETATSRPSWGSQSLPASPVSVSGVSSLNKFRVMGGVFSRRGAANLGSARAFASTGKESNMSKVELKEGSFVGSLDCGTTSVRFIVFDEHANIIAQHQLEFPQYYPHPGWHEQEPAEILKASEECIDRACEALERGGWKKESVKVIGITNQRETAVAWHRETGAPLCRAIVWDDARTKGTVAHFQHKLNVTGIETTPGTFKKGDEGVEALREATGLPLSTYFSAIKLCWMIDNHEEVKRAHDDDKLLFGTVESWLVYNLTGGTENGLHITEPTNASRTLLLDLHTLKWSPALLQFFGIRESVLPTLRSSSEEYGSLVRGPLQGVPIAGLVGDQQGALVGQRCFTAGEAKCTYGTGAFLLFHTGHRMVKSSHGLLTSVAYQPGPGKKPTYCLEGSIAVSGSAIKWLRDSMGMIKTADEVNTLAKKEPTSGGVYFVTAFSGLLAPYWDPGATGLLIGLSQYTNPSHIARATLEANAFQTRGVIESMLLDTNADVAEHPRLPATSPPLPTTIEANPIDSAPSSEDGTAKITITKDNADAVAVSVAVADTDFDTELLTGPDALRVAFTRLKVDGGVTAGELAMQVLADTCGFAIERPGMRESTALGSALLAGAGLSEARGGPLFGWDLERPETLGGVGKEGKTVFEPSVTEEEREERWKGWKKAVERSLQWDEAPEET